MGRLQTPQDRARVIDGLAVAEGSFDRKEMETTLGALPSRTFVLKSASSSVSTLVHSRWAMSFLRGPLTLQEVQRCQTSENVQLEPSTPPPPPPIGTLATQSMSIPQSDNRRWGPDGVDVVHLDVSRASYPRLKRAVALIEMGHGEGTTWRCGLYVKAQLHFDEGRAFKMDVVEHRLYFDTGTHIAPVDLDAAIHPVVEGPPQSGSPSVWPDNWSSKAQMRSMVRRIKRDILREETATIFQNKPLKMMSRAGEDMEAFQRRVAAEAMRQADDSIAEMKDKLDKEVTRWEDKRHRLTLQLSQSRVNAKGQMATEVVSAAETLYGLFLGRRRSLSTLASRRQQTVRAQGKVDKIEDQISEYELKLEAARDAMAVEIQSIRETYQKKAAETHSIVVGLELDDIEISEISALWIPF